MGSEQSTARNEQRNSRNVSQAEVNKALQRQRIQYEQRMREILEQATTRIDSQSTQPTALSPGPTGQSSTGVAPPRPPAPIVNNLERQRSPYNYTQNNLVESRNQPSSSLYPNLNDNGNSAFPGNNFHTDRQSPVGNGNEFVFVNSNYINSYGSSGFPVPSAPPAPSSNPRERSISRSRSRARDGEADITCPTCNNRFGFKIFNCPSGHASCMECKTQQRSCGRCGGTVTAMRNITMEEYVLLRRVPCPNEDAGCSLQFQLGDMDQHLKECPFKDSQCLLPGGMCKWRGKLSRMAAHFDSFHSTHRGDVDTENFLQTHNMTDINRMQLVKIGNFTFVFNMVVSRNMIFIAVQLLGTKVSASKWKYEIHLYNKAEPRRKYQYADTCFSTGETFNDIINCNKCAVLPLQYIKTFVNNGAVAYKYFITMGDGARVEEQKRDQSCARRGQGRGRGRGRGRGGHIE